MKFAVTSDLHGSPLLEKDMGVLHDVDTLLIAGDVFEMNRKIKKMTDFFDRIQSEYGVKNIIMTPGNHDHNIFEAYLEKKPHDAGEARRYPYIPRIYPADMMENHNVRILIDESIELDGIKIYGSPWSPNFCNWAFMKSEGSLDLHYETIPNDTDILLSHTPPWVKDCSIDQIDWPHWEARKCGSIALPEAIKRVKPQYLFCGHIHSGSHKEFDIDGTKCYNVSYLGEDYEPHYPVFTFELNEHKK